MNIIRAVEYHNSGKSALYFSQAKLRVTRRIASHLGGIKVANGFAASTSGVSWNVPWKPLYHRRCGCIPAVGGKKCLFDKVANRRILHACWATTKKSSPSTKGGFQVSLKVCSRNFHLTRLLLRKGSWSLGLVSDEGYDRIPWFRHLQFAFQALVKRN